MKDLLFLFFSLLIINSCGESTGDLENFNVPLVIGAGGGATGNAKMIRSVNDGANTYFYTLQNSRLSKYNDANNKVEYDLTYNAAGKLSSATGFYNTPNATTASVFNVNFVYDAGGILTGLSGTETNANVTYNISTTFGYSGGVIVQTSTVKTATSPLGTSTITNITNFSYSGVNLNKAATQYTETLNATTVGTSLTTVKFLNFDTKNNYLRGLPKEFQYFTTYINANENYFSPNNYLKKEIDVNGGTPTVLHYTITYDSDDYPIQKVTGASATSYIYQPL